jgi:hypothetical protein
MIRQVINFNTSAETTAVEDKYRAESVETVREYRMNKTRLVVCKISKTKLKYFMKLEFPAPGCCGFIPTRLFSFILKITNIKTLSFFNNLIHESYGQTGEGIIINIKTFIIYIKVSNLGV